MDVYQYINKMFKYTLNVKPSFNKMSISAYFSNILAQWNQIIGDEGKSEKQKQPQNIRFNLNASLNLLQKIKRSKQSDDKLDWLSIGTATPDV